MRLAVDVMGGDHAPDAILRGCLDALELLDADDQLVLVGRRDDIEEILTERGVNDSRLEIVHADDIIGMDETPVEAVRSKRESSMVKMALLGSHKADPGQRCDVVLSAGNTGACVSAATMHMKRLPGVHRPGIAITMPTFDGSVVLCDGGANPQPRPTHLWQYGLMAEVLASKAQCIDQPRIAMINIGSEEAKGTGLIKQVHELLKATPDINYIGFIEGRDLFDGAADVVVTDGFTGNTVLKTAEGLAKSIFSAITREIFEADPDLGLRLEPIFKTMFKKKDYHELGGAPLLGVNGNCVIAHGSSEARTIPSCIRTCQELVKDHINDAIVERLAGVEHIARAHHQEPA